MAAKGSIQTNLLGRVIQPTPRAPYAWPWTRESRGETMSPTNLATRARVVAVYTETETTGDTKGTVRVKVAAEALDGEMAGALGELYLDHFLLVPEGHVLPAGPVK